MLYSDDKSETGQQNTEFIAIFNRMHLKTPGPYVWCGRFMIMKTQDPSLEWGISIIVRNPNH